MQIQVGQELPAIELTITREGTVRYAGASTDFNPIHYSDFHAKQLGLTGCIAHGMWTMGAAVRIVTEWISDPTLIKTYTTRFVNPVPVPDNETGTKVLVEGKVAQISGSTATINITATSDGQKVLSGAKVTVELPTEESASCEVERVSAVSALGDGQLSVVEPSQPKSKNLSEHTTFRIGGPAKNLVIVQTQQDLIDQIKECDQKNEPVLVLSGGSNMLVSDTGFDGTVIKVATKGINAQVSSCGGAVVKVEAGEYFDDFVQYAISQEWSGIEALSGIPGLVGTTPIQNVGAYGADVAQTVTTVRTYDRETGQFKTFPLTECRFGYRTSVFKQTKFRDCPSGRYIVLDVTFQFLLGNLSAPIRYLELAKKLGVAVGQKAPMSEVRQAVLEIRSGKGMVLNPDDRDSYSAGSFFVNPILTAEKIAELPAEAPRFDAGNGLVKTSAAWLISNAGFSPGFGLGTGATISTKHVLALTNRSNATAKDIVDLASTIKSGVAEKFGVTLEAEPTLVGLSL